MLSEVVQDHCEDSDVNHSASLDLYTERFSFHFQGTKIKDFQSIGC